MWIHVLCILMLLSQNFVTLYNSWHWHNHSQFVIRQLQYSAIIISPQQVQHILIITQKGMSVWMQLTWNLRRKLLLWISGYAFRCASLHVNQVICFYLKSHKLEIHYWFLYHFQCSYVSISLLSGISGCKSRYMYTLNRLKIIAKTKE